MEKFQGAGIHDRTMTASMVFEQLFLPNTFSDTEEKSPEQA
jgi:hypothetical protein